MKKKYIQLGIFALVLLVMVGALVLLRRQPAVDEPEAPAEDIIYIYGDSSTEDIAPEQLDITNEFGEITIDNITPPDSLPAALDLTIRGWENLSLDSYSLGQAAANAKAMRAKDIISETATAEELELFGLAAPRATLTAKFPGGDTQVVLFGDNAPGGEGVYAKPKNGDRIYLISDGTATPYFKPATAYVNKAITATDPDFKGFDKITLSGASYPETLVIERTPEDSVSAAGIVLNSHAFISPIKRALDSKKGLEPLQSVYGLLANDVVAVDNSAATLEKYGLLDPMTIISVVGETPEMTFTLRISDPDETGEVHLIKDGSKVVYELSPSALPFLGLSLFDMMEKMIVVPNIKNVSKVMFKISDKTYEFDLIQEEESNNLDVTANGTPLPEVTDNSGKSVTGGENFRKLYQSMIACSYDEPLPNPATGADTSDSLASGAFLASIEYIYNTGRASDVLSFYAGPARKAVVRLNSEEPYYCQSVYLDTLFEDVEKVVNGVAVQPYL